jgi:hypothetical protein
VKCRNNEGPRYACVFLVDVIHSRNSLLHQQLLFSVPLLKSFFSCLCIYLAITLIEASNMILHPLMMEAETASETEYSSILTRLVV